MSIPPPLGHREYAADRHRFFGDLANMCLVSACYTSVKIAYDDKLEATRSAGRFKPGDTVVIPGFRGLLGLDLAFEPYPILDAFIQDCQPAKIVLTEQRIGMTSPLRESAVTRLENQR